MKTRLGIFLLTMALLIAARLVIMGTTYVFEPSESRYAAISANMALTRDWFAPSFTYEGKWEIFAGKPPLAFQASALSALILGGAGEFAVRLPAFLSFLSLLALLYISARKLSRDEALDPSAPLLATGICATSAALYATAGFCMTDLPLACCTSGALLIYCAWRARTLISALAIGALLALGMMIKGPISPLLFLLGALVDFLWRRFALKEERAFPPLGLIAAAIAIFLVAVIPYFALIEKRQSGFLEYFFINENLLRFLVKDYGDKYGAGRESFRGMAAIWAFLVTLPWSPWLAAEFFAPAKRLLERLTNKGAASAAPAAAAEPRRYSTALAAAAAITLFWCLTSRVPPTYLLPVVPLISLHIALHSSRLAAPAPAARHLWRMLPYAALACVIVLAATLGVTRLTKPRKLPGPDAPPKVSDHYFSYEFYHGPWGEGAPCKPSL